MLILAKRILAASVVATLALAPLASAQTKPATPPAAAAPGTPPGAPAAGVGKIAGVVTEKGQPVPYANIIILGTRQGTMTDDNGKFVIPGVNVGSYQIKLMATGYDPVIQSVRRRSSSRSTRSRSAPRSASTRSRRPPSRVSPPKSSVRFPSTT